MDQALNRQVEPLVSVLVITYNQEAYIARTLDSLLNQDCPFPYEILIGEDCSTDNTKAICEGYAKRHPDRFRLIAHPVNLGLMGNYIHLIYQARGRYLADCGGDDYWIATDKLRKQVAILETHPEVTLVAGNWQLLNEPDGSLQDNQMQLTTDRFDPHRFGLRAVADYLNRRNSPQVVLSASCFRTRQVRDLLEAHPDLFAGPDAACEDLPLTLLLLAQGPFYLQHEEVLVYRRLNESVSHHRSVYTLQKDFANRVFWQTWLLLQRLGMGLHTVQPYFRRQWNDMVHAAWATADTDWMKQQARRLSANHLKLPFKAACKAAILQCPPLYRWVNRLLPCSKSRP